MTDLVEKLRDQSFWYTPHKYASGNPLRHEIAAQAADEIERLRKIEEAVNWVLNDAAYKAPEQMTPESEIWIDRLGVTDGEDQCTHPNSDHAPGMEKASIWCPDCEKWAVKDLDEREQ